MIYIVNNDQPGFIGALGTEARREPHQHRDLQSRPPQGSRRGGSAGRRRRPDHRRRGKPASPAARRPRGRAAKLLAALTGVGSSSGTHSASGGLADAGSPAEPLTKRAPRSGRPSANRPACEWLVFRVLVSAVAVGVGAVADRVRLLLAQHRGPASAVFSAFACMVSAALSRSLRWCRRCSRHSPRYCRRSAPAGSCCRHARAPRPRAIARTVVVFMSSLPCCCLQSARTRALRDGNTRNDRFLFRSLNE